MTMDSKDNNTANGEYLTVESNQNNEFEYQLDNIINLQQMTKKINYFENNLKIDLQ